jgi:hypothetical protein
MRIIIEIANGVTPGGGNAAQPSVTVDGASLGAAGASGALSGGSAPGSSESVSPAPGQMSQDSMSAGAAEKPVTSSAEGLSGSTVVDGGAALG